MIVTKRSKRRKKTIEYHSFWKSLSQEIRKSFNKRVTCFSGKLEQILNVKARKLKTLDFRSITKIQTHYFNDKIRMMKNQTMITISINLERKKPETLWTTIWINSVAELNQMEMWHWEEWKRRLNINFKSNNKWVFWWNYLRNNSRCQVRNASGLWESTLLSYSIYS